MKKTYHMYIMASKKNGTLYVGVTGYLSRRIEQHKDGSANGFTKKYKIHMLVYYEEFDNPYDAIQREKQIKGGSRKQKLKLIESLNPYWDDLSDFF